MAAAAGPNREHSGTPGPSAASLFASPAARVDRTTYAQRPFVRLNHARTAPERRTGARRKDPHWTTQPSLRPGAANFAARPDRRVRPGETQEGAAGTIKRDEKAVCAMERAMTRDCKALRQLVAEARLADPAFDVAGEDAAAALAPLGAPREPNRMAILDYHLSAWEQACARARLQVTTAKALASLYETQDFASEARATVSHALKRLNDMEQMRARVAGEVVVVGDLLADRRGEAAALQASMRARSARLAERARRTRELRAVFAMDVHRHQWRPAGVAA